MTGAEAEEVLSFWVGEVDDAGLVAEEKSSQWWKKDPDLDRAIVARFGDVYKRLASTPAESQGSARQQLAAVIVLDQFSRNMFRGTARMY